MPVVGTQGAGGHIAAEAVFQAGGVVGGGAASGIAHEHRALHGDDVREMLHDAVHRPHHVPDPLADQGPPNQQSRQMGVTAGRAVLGPAALPEGPLLDRQRGKAFLDGAEAEVVVLDKFARILTGEADQTERNVRALGMSLHAYAEGSLPLGFWGRSRSQWV